MNFPLLTDSAILADFGGIGVLILVAAFAGCVVLSVGVAVFDRRRIQFVLAVFSCLFFCLFCIEFVFGMLAIFGVIKPGRYPPFGLMIPPITAIQFILYAVRLRRSSHR
jgi:hypothetical protein